MTMLENANRALAEIGTRSRLSVIDNSTTEGLYIGFLYPMLRNSMLRAGDYDWAMSEAATVVFATVPPSWNFAYTYPSNCVRIRQAVPTVTDPFDPRPVEWNLFLSGSSRILASKVALANLIFTRNDCDEAVWDSQFTDSFIRYLASSLTMALENRLEASEAVLREALAFAGIANMRDD